MSFSWLPSSEERSKAVTSCRRSRAFDIGAHRFRHSLYPRWNGTTHKSRNRCFAPLDREIRGAGRFFLTVCTGSALLAKTGFLDGKHATTNKLVYSWATAFGPRVIWKPEARWVKHENVFNSSGVSAGMDMTLAAIEAMHGRERAEQVAIWCEYDWRKDASWDPFAKIHGLV